VILYYISYIISHRLLKGAVIIGVVEPGAIGGVVSVDVPLSVFGVVVIGEIGSVEVPLSVFGVVVIGDIGSVEVPLSVFGVVVNGVVGSVDVSLPVFGVYMVITGVVDTICCLVQLFLAQSNHIPDGHCM